MAIKLAEAFVAVTARTAPLERGIDGARQKVKAGVNELRGVLAGFAAAAASIAGAGFLVSLAADAEETASKFETVFSDISADANKMAMELRNSFGLGSIEAKRLLGDTADLLSGFGFTQESALDLSSQVQKLAVDLASFTNVEGGAKTASDALTKALLGERESIKSLGIAILEEDVKKRVLLNTNKGLIFSTERQAKAAATLQLAQEQSKNAIGDFARTSGSLANQMRLVRTRLIDAAIAVGRTLLPPLQAIVPVINRLIEGFLTMNETLGGLPAIAGLAAAAIGTLKSAMLAYFLVTGKAISVTRAFKFALIGTGVGAFVVAVGTAVAGLFRLAEAIVNTTTVQDALAKNVEKFRRAWELVKQSVGTIINAIVTLFNKQIGGMADTFSGTVSRWIEQVADFVLNAAQWFNVMVNNWDTTQLILIETGKGLVNFLIKLFKQLPEVWAFTLGLMLRNAIDSFRIMAETIFGFFANFTEKVVAIIGGADIGEILSGTLEAAAEKAQSVGDAFVAGFRRNRITGVIDLSFPEANARRIRELMESLADEKKLLENQRKEVVDAAKKTPEGAKITQQITVELKAGFIGFTDLNKNIQNALFKKEGERLQLRTASATEAIRDAQKDQLAALDRINTTLNSSAVAVAVT